MGLYNQPRLDSAESVFFNRQLEHIYTKTYDIKFAELKARRFIPTQNEAAEGSTEVTYRQFTEVGLAKMISQSSRDLPRVDVHGIEFPRPVRWLGDSYGWTIMDVKAASKGGFDLEARKARTARKAIERKLDEIAVQGEPEHGIAEGFLNDSDITIDAATGVWSSLTADQIIADVSTMWQGIVNDSLGVETSDSLLLPNEQWALIATLPRSTNSDKTVLAFIKDAFPDLRNIEPWHRMGGAGAGGVDRAMMYTRSADHVTHEIPMEFMQLPVQEIGIEFIVNALAATAGVAFYYPLSARYMDTV